MISNKLRFVGGIVSALLVTACATINLDLPAVTDTPGGERLPGKVIWRDLLTHDTNASQEFYETLLGWEFESIGSDAGLASDSTYKLIRHKGRLIGGMIDTVALNNRSDISQWVVSMSVTNIDDAVARFSAAGGEVLTPAIRLIANLRSADFSGKSYGRPISRVQRHSTKVLPALRRRLGTSTRIRNREQAIAS